MASSGLSIGEPVIQSCTPEDYMFFIEQYFERLEMEEGQRRSREIRLGKEMTQFGFDDSLKTELRKVLLRKETIYLRQRRTKLTKQDFEKVSTIGMGSFAELSLVRHKHTLFAMKSMKKSDIIKRKSVAHILAERDFLSETDNWSIAKLIFSFQDKDCIYFVMDFVPGADLRARLKLDGIFSEEKARFYLAELVYAIEEVHARGFIHRDIKPENVLIGTNGHIKLSGFSVTTSLKWTHKDELYHNQTGIQFEEAEVDDSDLFKTLTIVGTPNYMAPEVWKNAGFNWTCDWWTLGVILYEMMFGHAPFASDSIAETRTKVLNWKETLVIPKYFGSGEAEDLIRRLITDSEQRLGRQRGSDEIKSHMFFNGIKFDQSLRSEPAPWKPELESETDTSNFDLAKPGQPLNQTLVLDETETKESMGFQFLDYRRFFSDYQEHCNICKTKLKTHIYIPCDHYSVAILM